MTFQCFNVVSFAYTRHVCNVPSIGSPTRLRPSLSCLGNEPTAGLFVRIAFQNLDTGEDLIQFLRISESNRLDQWPYGFPFRSGTECGGTNLHQEDVAIAPLDLQFSTKFGFTILGVEFQNDMAVF